MYNTIGNGGPEGNIGGFEDYSFYWSSSEQGEYHVWYVYFSNGGSGDVDKVNPSRVRVICAF